jgi:hypothetical protein
MSSLKERISKLNWESTGYARGQLAREVTTLNKRTFPPKMVTLAQAGGAIVARLLAIPNLDERTAGAILAAVGEAAGGLPVTARGVVWSIEEATVAAAAAAYYADISSKGLTIVQKAVVNAATTPIPIRVETGATGEEEGEETEEDEEEEGSAGEARASLRAEGPPREARPLHRSHKHRQRSRSARSRSARGAKGR